MKLAKGITNKLVMEVEAVNSKVGGGEREESLRSEVNTISFPFYFPSRSRGCLLVGFYISFLVAFGFWLVGWSNSQKSVW